VPLIERLSNRQIGAELDRLPSAGEAAVSVGQARTCRCGCGQPVTGTRKFVSQDHYNIWLSAANGLSGGTESGCTSVTEDPSLPG
jgi:hypothetical protein